MATYTGTKAEDGAQPIYLHTGAVVVKSTFTWTATASVGDVVQMIKVPRGAIIDEIVVFDTGGDHANIGDGVSVARYFASASALTTRHVLTNIEGVLAGIGYQYDISDAAAVAYDTLDLSIVVAGSTPADVTTMIATYHCDD